MAAAISLFLTDQPPDDELLAAAASNALGTPEQVRSQATRLLATPAAHANFEVALIKYFSLAKAPTVILNRDTTPGLTVTAGMQSSIFHEGELFMRNLLLSAPLENLLTSRQTWTSAQIATQIYGVDAPREVDADGFGLIDLPGDRSGLLTLSTFLLSGARSTGSSPVARGLAVNRAVVCEVNPPFPQVTNPVTGQLGPDPEVAAAIAGLADQSELEKARYRAARAKCAGCHQQFDPYGMVLEPYDAVGRFRSTDLAGRPIDERWTTTALPQSVGGAKVTSAAEAAQRARGEWRTRSLYGDEFHQLRFRRSIPGRRQQYRRRPAPQTATCAVQGVIDNFAVTDRSFPR